MESSEVNDLPQTVAITLEGIKERLDRLQERSDYRIAELINLQLSSINYPPQQEHSLRSIQARLPWTIRYSQDFRLNPLTHKDFQHALIHVGKAVGKLFELCDDCDHDRNVADSKELKEQYSKYIADLVLCALRMANVFPGGVIDLEGELINRIESKNNVKLFPVKTSE